MDTSLLINILLIVALVGLGIVFTLVAFLLFYVITTLYALKRAINQIEKNLHRIGDVSKELLEDVRNNKAFKFLFRKNKNHHRN